MRRFSTDAASVPRSELTDDEKGSVLKVLAPKLSTPEEEAAALSEVREAIHQHAVRRALGYNEPESDKARIGKLLDKWESVAQGVARAIRIANSPNTLCRQPTDLSPTIIKSNDCASFRSSPPGSSPLRIRTSKLPRTFSAANSCSCLCARSCSRAEVAVGKTVRNVTSRGADRQMLPNNLALS